MDDFTLLRYVRARPDDVGKALEMFRESMSWRASKGMNALFRELHPRAGEPTDRQRAARAHYYGGMGGTTREGVPYFVLRIGQADLAGYAREHEMVSVMMDADAANMEMIFRTVRLCSAASGSFVRVLIVVDLAGFSLSALRHIGLVKSIMKIGPAVFPEGASKVLIVNAPRIFAAAWRVVSPLLPARSRAKVNILSASSTPGALSAVISPTELPRFLGGEQPEDQTLVARAEPVPVGGYVALKSSPRA